jgi:tRNA threonylcarbamoyladenosine biosynthesis protein TsaE
MKGQTDRLKGATGPVRTWTVRTRSPEETIALGRRLGAIIPLGCTISLEGGLGAGKTVMVKGIAAGIGIETEVLSPTFILVEEYRGGEALLLHYDLYRLDELGEVERIGLFDAVDGRSIIVVEWGDRLPQGTMAFDMTVSIRISGSLIRDVEISAAQQIEDALEDWEEGP